MPVPPTTGVAAVPGTPAAARTHDRFRFVTLRDATTSCGTFEMRRVGTIREKIAVINDAQAGIKLRNVGRLVLDRTTLDVLLVAGQHALPRSPPES
jgi:hypothetical protein